MKTTKLTLAVDSEKLIALRQYAAKKDVNINAELNETIEKLYEKHVPAAVREFISERESAVPVQRHRPSGTRNLEVAE